MNVYGERPDLVFLGPSLSHDEARRIAPDAVLLPPAGMGDVLTALERFRPHAIALIDGNFLHTMAVFHKEIVDALARGVWVIGASSMGALRAAECAPYGMIPVGEIAAAYLSGELEGDDEVALVHADADDGYRPLSDAMVEIRATVRAATTAGLLTAEEADRLIAGQKRRWFPERTLAATVDDVRDHLGWPAEQVAAYRAFVRANRVDLKSRDARAALQALVELPAGPVPEAERPLLESSGVYQLMAARDRFVGDGPPGVRLEDIRTHAALTDRGYLTDWRRAAQRAALLNLSQYLDLEPPPEATVAARRRVAHAFGVAPDELDGEAAALDLSPNGLEVLLGEEARLEQLERWVFELGRGHSVDVAYHNLMRLQGRYRKLRADAEAIEKLAAASEERDIEPPFLVALSQHMVLSGFTLPVSLDEFVADSGFGTRTKLYDRLMTHLVAERALLGIPVGMGFEFVDDDTPDIDHGAGEMNARGAR